MGMVINPYRHPPISLGQMEDLFSGGEIGDYWRFDAANTDGNVSGDPVTAATGLVNGHILEDGDPANVPNLNASLDSTFFAAANDRLFYDFGSTVAQPGTIIIALTSANNVSSRVVLTGSAAGLRWQLSVDGSFNIIGFAGASLDSTRNTPFLTQVVTLEVNGASSAIRFNGTTTATGNMGTQGTDRITVGSLYDGSNGLGITVYSLLFINRLLTSAERDGVERLFGSHAGLSW